MAIYSTIFFLVQDESYNIYIMRFRSFPWLVNVKTTDGDTLNDEITVTNKLITYNPPLKNKFSPEKLMKASILQPLS
jgi:hypothetical protein